jgi:predicted MPP superfamily phosphohydrolase
MPIGLPHGSFRTYVVAFAVLAQVYLFLRIRHAFRSSRRHGRFTSAPVIVAGAVIIGLFVMNWHVMFRPIPWVDPPPAARTFLFYLPAVWTFGSIFSALLLFLTQILSWVWRIGRWIHPGPAGQANPRTISLGRRRFLRAGVGTVAASPFLLSGYGAVFAGKDPVIEEITLPFGLPLRVVQLSDIHAGVFMTREMMRLYVDLVIALKPELFVLTGDYISNSTLFFPGFAEEMSRVAGTYGSFAALGNHENWYGEAGYYESVFRKHGIRLLLNTNQVIRTEMGSFAIAGIDDLRSGRPDLAGAIKGLEPSAPTLLLSHRPEIFPRAAALGVSLTLSGHYHGGQVKLTLPGGDISLAHMRTPYPEGMYRIGHSTLYVSRGIGTTFTPVRLNARPEVTLLHLT